MIVDAPGKPELEVAGDVYHFTWPCGIEAELERFAEHRDELTAEVTIRSDRQPNPGLLHAARLNLMSTQSRSTLGRELARREPDLDWGGILEALCFLARERYRAGEPSIDLRFYERPAEARWLVEPFVERGGPTVLFADGGTGKSLIALAIAITVASGRGVLGQLHGTPVPVMFLDYETDAATVDERLQAILAGAAIAERPPLLYRRMSASLMEAAPTLRREIFKHDIGMVVVDSLGAARAGEPESADVTIRLFNAARSFGIPMLAVDHVTKASGNDSTRPFGSTYTHNLARLTWGADKAQDAGEDSMVVSLRNYKRNNGRLVPRLGYRLEFTNAEADELIALRFHHQDLAQVPELAAKLPLKVRILAELRGGALQPKELAELLEHDLRAVSARLGELRKDEKIVRLDDGRVALRAREAS